jgi:proteasome lid subunit RPN8/RPN11
VKIAARVLVAIEAHAREAAPEECCGLLLGTGDLISQAMRARNRAEDRERRYEIDPHDHFAAIRHGRAHALDVVGAYHSHPRSAPTPSPTDQAHAFEEFVVLIAGRPDRRRDGHDKRVEQAWTIQAWRFHSGNFAEVPLVSDA